MAEQKRISPYTMLKNTGIEYANAISNRKVRTMFSFSADKLGTGSYHLGDVYERVRAAEQLGFDVMIRATETGMSIVYIEKLPYRPLEFL